MTRVFISYAKADQQLVPLLVERLRKAGAEPVWWEDARQRGQSVVSSMEQNILKSDIFLVLLSPQFLTSLWCRRERDLAMHHENDLGRQFIYVLKTRAVDHSTAGFLRDYDRLDAVPPLTDQKLDAIVNALPLGVTAEVAGTSEPAVGPMPTFRNRHDELLMMLNGLTTAGGRDLWVVVAPPRMGKSWLLDRLHSDLLERDQRWSVRLLDLREHPQSIRSSTTRLLGTLLDVDPAKLPDDGPLTARDLRKIAATLARRHRPQLYVLDSADLLAPAMAEQARSALTDIHRLVQRSGDREARLALVVGTRRHDEWRGLGANPRTGQRFEPLPLSEFAEYVVYTAIVELGRNLGADREWDCARRLHQLSEGLPALLVRSLQWAVRHQFLEIEESESESAFDEVARDYIRDDLLAVESLLPSGSLDPDRSLDVLHRALRALTAYRFFTQSHLQFHLDKDADFARALGKAGLSVGDLWDVLGRTSLCGHSNTELWLEFEPSIRRLLHRYFYRSDAERIAAHNEATTFYMGWTADHSAGREQPVVLVECLWHEASRLVLEQPDDVPRLLPVMAADLTRTFTNTSLYRPQEFSRFVAGRMRGDEEFQRLVSHHEGLFDELVKSVVLTIGGNT
jgi:hypothetical protein